MEKDNAGRRVLTIQKESDHFVFRYQQGSEEQLLDTFVELANDEEKNFDWFDAAVLSFQLSKNLVEEADKILCPQKEADRTLNEGDIFWEPEL